MVRRISSIFSTGSSSSDQTQSSNSSRLSACIHPARPSKEHSPARLAAKSTPELRTAPNSQELNSNQSSRLTIAPVSSFLSPTDGDQTTHQSPRLLQSPQLLHSPQLLSPVPIDTTSPNGSRRSSIGSRRLSGVGNEDFTHQFTALLKPLPIRSSSPSATRPFSGRSVSGNNAGGRPASRPASRPGSPIKSRQTPTTEQKLSKRRSWLPGKAKADVHGQEHAAHPLQAWAVTPQEKIPYDTAPLANFQRVPELWDENGDALVYLHAREYGRGPSFRIDSSLFSASKNLTLAAHGATHTSSQPESNDLQHRPSVEHTKHLMVNDAASPTLSLPGSSGKGSSKGSRSFCDFSDETSVKKDVHLCLALPLQADLSVPTAKATAEDIETLVTIRNVFAFLAGQPLVVTPSQSSIFTMFMNIADVLHRYEFTNLDGSTLGEEVAGAFGKAIEDFDLADVRSSREKTIEAIVLGERMRSYVLYNEGFVHAVGKYNDISGLGSSKFDLISGITRKRLERAHLDLFARLRNIRTRLDDFDFPSLFAGFANSTTSAESKVVHFKDWKNSYMSMRRHVVNLYKHKYGAWPPKARSKKNDFEESGLNRKLLLEVYQDFSDLYDVLVDRKAHTTRAMGTPAHLDSDNTEKPRVRALRRVLDEYDRSTPPVQPPVPFDIPRLPSLCDTRRGFENLDPKKQKKECRKKLEDDEINQALMQSYNRDSVKSTPFLEAFMAFERRSARGKTIEEIADLRDGQWLFMYAVLESLPLLVVDAPGVKWSKGVEYFLCEVPKGSAPWVQENHSLRQSWYGVAGGAGMVSLPADIVEHGVEGIYRRSHCWQVAEKWTHSRHGMTLDMTHLAPPNDGLLSPTLSPSSPDSRPAPGRRRASSFGDLEHLPLPPGVVLDGSKPTSKHAHDPSKTFGAILAQTDGVDNKKK